MNGLIRFFQFIGFEVFLDGFPQIINFVNGIGIGFRVLLFTGVSMLVVVMIPVFMLVIMVAILVIVIVVSMTMVVLTMFVVMIPILMVVIMVIFGCRRIVLGGGDAGGSQPIVRSPRGPMQRNSPRRSVTDIWNLQSLSVRNEQNNSSKTHHHSNCTAPIGKIRETFIPDSKKDQVGIGVEMDD